MAISNKQQNSEYFADESGFVLDLRKKDLKQDEENRILKCEKNKSSKKEKRIKNSSINIFRKSYYTNLIKLNKDNTLKKVNTLKALKSEKNEILKHKNDILRKKKENLKIIKDLDKIIAKESKLLLKDKKKIANERKSIKKLITKSKKKSFSLNKIFKDFFDKKKIKKLYKQRVKGINKRIRKEQRKFFRLRVKKSKSIFNVSNPFISFALILLFIILPVKFLNSFNFFNFKGLEDKIMNYSFGAVGNFEEASDLVSDLNLELAVQEFEKADLNFLEAEKDLEEINGIIFKLASFSSNPKIKLAAHSKDILEAGSLSSKLASSLVKASDKIFLSEDFAQSLDEFILEIKNSVSYANDLFDVLNKIPDKDIPLEYQDKFVLIKKQSKFILDNVNKFVSSLDNLKEVLGLSMDKRYLLVFQNNAELRASGGFLGSYALIDIRDGKIRNLEVPAGGSYDLEAGLNGKKIASPEALHLVNPNWNFWDANWWPDWPKTASHLMWFYGESGGPTVDGIISLTPTVVERALEITGPIDMSEEYGVIISADNFWELTQKTVEYDNLYKESPDYVADILNPDESSELVFNEDYILRQGLEENVDNKPKKIIGDLMAKIIEELPKSLNKENLVKIISMLSDSVLEKQLMMYFSDESLQFEIERLGLAGEMKDSNYDYLMLVDSNIGGKKSDRIMQRKLNLETEIDDDGNLINTVNIEYAHPGLEGDLLTNVRNVDWLRIYTPLGSEIISASGFDQPDEKYFEETEESAILLEDLRAEREALIDEASLTKTYNDLGKTVFANWVMTDPGEKNVISVKYKLPFNINDLKDEGDNSWLERISNKLDKEQEQIFPYSLLVQKQPGVIPYEFTATFKEQDNYSSFWQGDEGIKKDGYIWNYLTNLNSDKFISVILK